MNISQPFKIMPRVQHFSWGQNTLDCLVAQFSHAQDPQQNYAELWYGAHPKLPAQVVTDDDVIFLDELVKQQPLAILGSKIAAQFNNTLPFLFKILSIASPLSIQAHPDLILAQRLHARFPQHYPDANHKPEFALALTPAQLLYGFRSAEEVLGFAQTIPEFGFILKRNLGSACHDLPSLQNDPHFIQNAYSAIFHAPASDIQELSIKLYQRITDKGVRSAEENLILTLQKLYPVGDVGLFALLFHNLCQLNTGQGIFIAPNTPHAYLCGELMECMANSDNTIRGGLTNKFIDVETITQTLCFAASLPQIITENQDSLSVQCLCQEAKEFVIEKLNILPNSETNFSNGDAVKLIFCLTGSCRITASGKSLTLVAGEAAIIPAIVAGYTVFTADAQVYRIGV